MTERRLTTADALAIVERLFDPNEKWDGDSDHAITYLRSIRADPTPRRLIAPEHYPYNDEVLESDPGSPTVVRSVRSSNVNGAILAVLRNMGDHAGLWTYPRDVMDALLAIEVDGYKLFQLIELGRQAVRVGIVDRQ